MASKGSTYINDLLKLELNATPIANIADNAASSPLTALFIALHSADPGVGGSQTTSEISYTGYARVSVARTSGGFTVSGTGATNAATVTFGTCTAGSATATHFSIGTIVSGAGKILRTSPLTNSVAISLGNPVASFGIGALAITES
jgi:hypothetical protein